MTLYELLTLKAAYASDDRLKLIELIRLTEAASPRSSDARIPRGPGDDRDEGDRQGPEAALPVGRRDGRGPPARSSTTSRSRRGGSGRWNGWAAGVGATRRWPV